MACTNSEVPLAAVLCETFSDGSSRVRPHIEASNGVVYKIDTVLQPLRLALAGK